MRKVLTLLKAGFFLQLKSFKISVIMSGLSRKTSFKGFKLAIPSRNYNATVTHYHQILGTTCGHPGTWNDKTLILSDDFICGVL